MAVSEFLLFGVFAALIVFVITLLMNYIKQPYVIGYIIAGMIIGPFGFSMLEKTPFVDLTAEIGIILLLFFIGMEISISKIISSWKVAVFGTISQIILSVLAVFFVGSFFDWSFQRILLVGFVISISSTAVAMKLLESWNELSTAVGQNVLSILLIQDLLIVPMLILLNFMSGQGKTGNFQLSIIGTIMVVLTFIVAMFIRRKKVMNVLVGKLEKDYDLQIFAAIILCFGLASIALFFQLSAALGAFLAGILVAESRVTHWVVKNLEPFRALFVAVFFIYIGLIFDLSFLFSNFLIIGLITLAVFVTNNIINTVILMMLGNSRKESIYAGALLAQIGEFSFLLGTAGYSIGFIEESGYKLIISVICMALLLSPLWILMVRKLLRINNEPKFIEM
ncbi:TPA: cation:proton antiporter [Candidatus Woesearchaeota archaeon]|nr:hypothetical protein QT06_C0001G1185 [archaeon GW2011_AR15]MBS3104345.1 cation:proton antiporter [Candidatus Woesearchaeota archaeon]HIH40871.1 cation:proton antiporter [Candidatus Woesearchaeota archaeon]